MKRGILMLIFIILVLPTVAATVSITGPEQSKYNIGDTIDVSGYVFEAEDLTGFLQMNVECNNASFPKQLIPISLNGGEQKTFSQLGIPDVTTTSSMAGTCSLKITLLVGGLVVEEDSSSSFTITKDLTGLFDVDKTKIQMGDSFQLNGVITKINGEKVTGSAEIYFEREGVEYLIDLVPVYGGTLSYVYDSSNSYPADYAINIIVRDSYGNEQRFDNVETVQIIDEISVFLDTEEDSVLPGGLLEVFGTVMDIEQNPVEQATVELSFDDSELLSTSLIGGAFSTTLQISSTLTSGEHTLEVFVEDLNGNKGRATAVVEIIPVVTSLKNNFGNASFNPSDSLELEVLMYDQAGDLMTGNIVVEIYDSTEIMISQKEVSSSERLLFEIPEFANPGSWKIVSYNGDVRDEDEINVNTIQDLVMWVENEVLYIKNIGNVRYKDDLNLAISGAGYDYNIKKTKSIAPNETIMIDLANELPSGSYSIELPTGNALLNVDDVEILNGTSRYKMTWMYIILALIFVGGLSYMVYGRVKAGKKPTEERRFGKRPAEAPMIIKKKKLQQKPSLTFGKEEGLADFKKRVVKDIKETEEKFRRDEELKNRDRMRGGGSLATVMGKNPREAPKQEAKQENFFGKLFD
ncbi:MAG: hypothetical protein ABIJ18_00500 [archaeon]